MTKPAFCICFVAFLFLTSFSILTITLRGVSNKHCLLPFFHFSNVLLNLCNNSDET